MDEFKQKCLMCFTQTRDLIKIFSRKGRSMKIAEIVSRHFWFEIEEKDIHSTNICKECWNKTNGFHEYYCNVEKLFEKYIIKQDPNDSVLAILNETDAASEIKEIKNEASSDINEETNQGIENDIIPDDLVDDDIDNGNDQNDSDCSNIEFNKKIVNGTDDSNHGEPAKPTEKASKSQKINEENELIREYFDMHCELCSHMFQTFLDARAHYRKLHNITGYLKCCSIKAYRRCKILEHINYHMNPNIFKCDQCHKNYKTKKEFLLHQKRHNSNTVGEFNCNSCEKFFSYKSALKRHMTAHVKEEDKKFICDDCDKRFAIKSALFAHIRNVHQSALVQVCDICAKTFKNKYILEQHYKLHSIMPKLKCSICGALLKTDNSLRSHMRFQHSNTDPEQTCKVCGKVTRNGTALREHMRYVHSERTHKCTLCDKAFKKSIGLKEHMASHTGTSLYSCPYCTRTFTCRANMHKHRKILHPDQWLRDRRKPQT